MKASAPPSATPVARGAWTGQQLPPLPPMDARSALRLDARLRRRVRLRDAIETSVALLLAPAFALFAAWVHGIAGMLPAASSAMLAAWCLVVPVRLWWSRRLLRGPEPTQDLRRYLAGRQLALQSQAAMLRSAGRWYVAPFAVGVTGLFLSLGGWESPGPGLVGSVLAFAVLVELLNRRVAAPRFDREAQAVATRLAELQSGDDARPGANP